MFIYKIDILEKLKEAGYNTTRLRREKLLTESAITDLRNGKVVGIISLEKICALLETQPGDLIEYKRG
ncbi:MAG: helix-turn-helix domain-containing protein [Bacilli bacterium]|nr:helix-turn-helix domain-containing protein [Bacilli bacterium]